MEAKSTESEAPELSAIGFDALREHMKDNNAQGCLLVAPGYPGASLENDSQAAKRAITQNISCWTVEQLATFLEKAQERQLTARDLLDIVLNKFAPADVDAALKEILSEPDWSKQDLYRAILDGLRRLEGKYGDSPRNISMVMGIISEDLDITSGVDVRNAIKDLAGASQGGMVINDQDQIILNVTYEELERRLSNLVNINIQPRRRSNFREYDAKKDDFE